MLYGEREAQGQREVVRQPLAAFVAQHHCTQPLHRHLDINATARASLYIYNTKDEVDRFIVALQESIDFFKM